MNYSSIVSIFSTCLLFPLIIFYPSKSLSQTLGGCFMEGVDGQAIDLSSLCGGGDNSLGSNGINSNKFEVPIKRRQSGIPVVNVNINGQNTYEMLVDTGATATVLTVKMAQELNLKAKKVVLVQTPNASATPFPTTQLKSLRVGGNTLTNLEVLVSPTLPIGLLGQDAFKNFDITIKKNVIQFQRR